MKTQLHNSRTPELICMYNILFFLISVSLFNPSVGVGTGNHRKEQITMKMAFDHVAVIKFHHLLLIIFCLCLQAAFLIVISSASYDISKPGCVNKCGNISIPYPFGIGDENCFLDTFFNITCNATSLDPPKAFLGKFELLDIDLQGQLRAYSIVAEDCYAKNGTRTSRYSILGGLRKFIFSDTRNKLVAIGCDTIAYISGSNYTTGCVSLCNSNSIEHVSNGSCTGIGCCQASIPTGLKNYGVTLSTFNNHTNISDFNPCSYAFLVEENRFNFSSLDLNDNQMGSKLVPVVIDWAVGNETCEEAKKNLTGTYLCGVNSYCYDPPNDNGYRCNCTDGYEGNPYLNGCQDIDECKIENDCLPDASCINEIGKYSCSCPRGYRGDGKKNGQPAGCEKVATAVLWIKVTVGIGSSFLFLLVVSSWLYWGFKKRKLMQMKEKFYRQNGGLMFEKIMKEQHDNNLNVKIFTDEELKKATNNYDESRIIGRGGFGTVYKGILTGKTTVAIKKSKIVDNTQTEQFVNEVAVLSQINHRNVVKLLGCCLENEVPLLVYEFVTNGTLFQHLHDEGRTSLLSWDDRLRIAAEIATSLSYLHSEASIPIIHRDVKSSNILLDDNYTAKVADFGASRLVPLDQTQLSTLVLGTVGYLDPEYLHTSQLTEKSDVYSFGVLLAELLTGKKALSFERPKEEANLATYFISAMKEDRLIQILEDHLVIEESVEQLQQVAELTKRCLKVEGEKRPTMKEVAIILDGLRRSVKAKHPCVLDNEPNREENVYLQGNATNSYTSNGDGYDGLNIKHPAAVLDNEDVYLLAEATNSYTCNVAGYDSLNIDLVPASSGR